MSRDLYTIRNITKGEIYIFKYMIKNNYDKSYRKGPVYVESSTLKRGELYEPLF